MSDGNPRINLPVESAQSLDITEEDTVLISLGNSHMILEEKGKS
jgi:hypothetical protein